MGDWFSVTGNPRDERPVHLARRCPKTDRVGGWGTPDEDTLTACGETWEETLPIGRSWIAAAIAAGKMLAGQRARKHVTLMLDLVTCSRCLAWARSRPDAFDNGLYVRTRDGGRPF